MKKLWSIFTDDMERCMITGRTDHIERHHVFGGANRKRSEKYGFIAPLHASIHPNGAFRTIGDWTVLDHNLKRACQEYYIKNIGTREEWYQEFGRYYDYEMEGENDKYLLHV